MIGGVTVDLRRPHDAPRPVGRGRSHLQRPARRQSPGVEQPARRPGLRRPRRRGRVGGRARRCPTTIDAVPLENPPVPPPTEPLDLADIRNSLKSLMWRAAGVRRDADGLHEAAAHDRRLAALRPGPAVRRPRRLGTAEHADRRPRDDRRRAAPRGIPRRPPADRLSRSQDDAAWKIRCGDVRDGASAIQWPALTGSNRILGHFFQPCANPPRHRRRSRRYRHAENRRVRLACLPRGDARRAASPAVAAVAANRC